MNTNVYFDSEGRAHIGRPDTIIDADRRAEARVAAKFAAIEERQAAEAKAAKVRREREQAEAQQALSDYRERAEAAWVSAGGSSTEFAAQWPKLRTEYLAEQARERLTRKDKVVAAEVARLRADPLYQV